LTPFETSWTPTDKWSNKWSGTPLGEEQSELSICRSAQKVCSRKSQAVGSTHVTVHQTKLHRPMVAILRHGGEKLELEVALV
jgi:hypothetical protein